jgi:hypothetical protein
MLARPPVLAHPSESGRGLPRSKRLRVETTILPLGKSRTHMNILSAVLRLICGVVLMIAAAATYHRASAHVAAGEPIQVAGITIGATPGQFSIALGVIAVIGLLLVILGIVTLFKKPA